MRWKIRLVSVHTIGRSWFPDREFTSLDEVEEHVRALYAQKEEVTSLGLILVPNREPEKKEEAYGHVDPLS